MSKPARKRWLAIVKLPDRAGVVDLVFTWRGVKYVQVAGGKQLSMGMEIPMSFMYGIMPVCGVICARCIPDQDRYAV